MKEFLDWLRLRVADLKEHAEKYPFCDVSDARYTEAKEILEMAEAKARG